MSDERIRDIVKGYRMCIDDLKMMGIQVSKLEAKADYLFPLIKQHPEKFDKL